MFALSLLVIAPALAGADRVPQDYATIQAAVDKGSAAVIQVDAGHWAGATVDRPVSIIGAPGAVIDRGVRAVRGAKAAFILTGGADDAQISGFSVDCTSPRLDLGVYASVPRLGGAADRVAVSDNSFMGCVQGVTNQGSRVAECEASVDGGAYWVIENNTFDGFSTRSDGGTTGGGIGIALFNVMAADVVSNHFVGSVADTPAFSTTGVSVSGCIDCTIAANNFAVLGGHHYWTSVANHGFYQAGGAASSGLILADNDATRDSAPHFGVNFRSYDSFDTELSNNLGTAYIDHGHCGDGRIEVVD